MSDYNVTGRPMPDAGWPREWWESDHPQEARCVSCGRAVRVSVRRLMRADAPGCGRVVRVERELAQCTSCYIDQRREALRRREALDRYTTGNYGEDHDEDELDEALMDPQEPEEPEVWHDDDVELHDDGTATIHTATNDNDDDGWPDPAGTESWSTRWRSWESALRHVGKSRVGMTGIRVTVRVNGREYTGRWPEDRRDWPLNVNACARCGGAIRAGDEFVYELAPPLAVAHQGCAGSWAAGPLAKARSD